MFFDCLALGMGLFASVMATWEPNGKFTYGYSRVETLSGFANGLFLCLISIFIVFEAIQRLLDPPEMNTSQLLVVSSVGLAVNLVGMVATGGHHHHGHSHGGHDHGVRRFSFPSTKDRALMRLRCSTITRRNRRPSSTITLRTTILDTIILRTIILPTTIPVMIMRTTRMRTTMLVIRITEATATT